MFIFVFCSVFPSWKTAKKVFWQTKAQVLKDKLHEKQLRCSSPLLVAVLLVAIQFMPLVIGAAVPLLNPKGAKESKTAALRKKESDATAGLSGDRQEAINDYLQPTRDRHVVKAVATLGKAASASTDAAKEVASTAMGAVSAAKSFASWARAKIRGGGAATKRQGSRSPDAPHYDEEHPGPPPESH